MGTFISKKTLQNNSKIMDQQAQQSALIEQHLQSALVQAEKNVDQELSQLKQIVSNDKELLRIREERKEQLKKELAKRAEYERNGHGKLSEMRSDRDLFDSYKDSLNKVVLFYSDSMQREIEPLQKMLQNFSKVFMSIRFMMIRNERAPFLAKKLKLPSKVSLVFIKESDILKYMDCMKLLEQNEERAEARLKRLFEMFIDLKKKVAKQEDAVHNI